MNVTEREITGALAVKIRKDLGMTQRQFWHPLGVSQSVASSYETERNGVEIPQSVRTLLVVVYVAKLSIDASSEEGVEELTRLAKTQSKFKLAKAMAKEIIKDLDASATGINMARTALESI